MKRSEINKTIKDFEELLEKHSFKLPPFLSFTPEEWETKGHEYDEIRENLLGWDITDFGRNDFRKTGLSLATIRNGNFSDPKYGKPYAEKVLMLYPGQITPYHFHRRKMEDIINRGGGDVLFQLYNSDKGAISFDDIMISKDGCQLCVKSGEDIILKPGESITLPTYCYHEFSVPGDETTLIGEISMCNDDKADNCFLEAGGRFPAIEEDESPYRLLCNEYPSAKD